MARTRKEQPRIRVLIGSATALGPGKVDLLEAIAEGGSISAAARTMNMSYRRAWLLVDAMNRCFHGDVVVATTGGHGGGGAALSELGHEVLRRYREMEAKAAASIKNEVAAFAELLREPED